jgi:hypothetical protein
MSDNKINSGVSTSCCSEGPPSGHQLMTLLIKTAGGRESVMVHLGRGNLIPERSGDRYPTEFNRVASIVPGAIQRGSNC